MIEILPATLRDASYVVANMRSKDRQEVMCQLAPGTTDRDIAYGLLIGGGETFAARIDGQPVAFFGTQMLNIASLCIWAVGTKRMLRAVPAISRFVLYQHMPDRIAEGYLMMEARSHIDHVDAHRWMRAMGAEQIGEPFLYGRSRELFLLFRWTRDVFDGIAAKRRRPK